MKGFHQILFFVLTLTSIGSGFKVGAPSYSCQSLTPAHGNAKAQSTSAPYVIETTASAGDQGYVNITLRSSSTGVPFSGFILRVDYSNSSENVEVTSGSFIIESGNLKIQRCFDGRAEISVVTHTSSVAKYSEKFVWQAPSGYEGEVVFLVTFVKDFATFWKPIQSNATRVTRKSEIIEDENGLKMPLSNIMQKMYNGCGSTKNCLYTPDDCLTTQNCDGLLTMSSTQNKSYYSIEMFGKNSIFVAVGFSDDTKMGGDSIFECVHEQDTVNAYRSWNVPRAVRNLRLADKDGVTLQRGVYEDKVVYCKIKISAVVSIYNTTFDLNKNRYYVTLAGGKEIPDGIKGIGYHDVIRVTSKGRFLLPVVSDPADEAFYNDCGTEMVCYGYPGECLQGRNCRFVTKAKGQDEKFIVTMMAKNAMYIATALTDDQKRGNDHIVECLNNASTIQTYRSWNVPQSFDNLRMGTAGVELLSGHPTSDGLICTVAFDPSVIPSFKLDQKYYLILVAGSTLGHQQVGYHNLVKKFNNDTVSLAKKGEDRSDLFYKRCGVNKRCFGVPDGCVQSKSCDLVVAMANDNVGNRYTFHIVSKIHPAPGYIAVGLSHDQLMGDDAIIECVREKEVVKTYMSWNLAENKTNERAKHSPMTHLFGSYVDGKLECIVMFQNPNFIFRNKSFDLTNDKYVLMLAAGSSATPPSNASMGGIDYHDIMYITTARAEPLHLMTNVESLSKFPLLLHGIFMIIAWIGCSSVAIIIARFYKNSPQSLLGSTWIKWHQYSMYLASCLTITGVLTICLYIGRVNIGPRLNHSFLGFVAFALIILQPLIAFFRPNAGSRCRVIFNITHWFVGNALHILSVIIIFFSVHLKKSGLPNWTYWVLASHTLYYIAIYLTLMIIENFEKFNEKKVLEYGIRENGEKIPTSLPSQYSVIKSQLFKLHLLVTGLYVFSLSYIIVSSIR